MIDWALNDVMAPAESLAHYRDLFDRLEVA
jgi:hypothetical protein